MYRKLVCIVLVLGLVISAFAGCGPKKETGSTDTSASTTTSDNSAKKVIELSIGWDGALGVNDDDYGKYVQDKLKIKLTPVSVANDKIKLMATSDDLPDMFPGGVGDATFNQFKEEGLIRDIPESMLANYPRLKAMTEANAATMAYKKMTGKIWDIPRPQDSGTPGKVYRVCFTIRWDWAQKLGVTKVPETLDEYYDLLKKYTFNDPDGNGAQDTYGIDGWIWSVHYIPWADEYNWVKEDGKWVPGYMSKAMLPALKWWNRLVVEGIMPGDFANANEVNDFMQNRIGSMQHNADSYHLWDKLLVKFGGAHSEELKAANKSVMDVLKILPPLKMDANTAPRWSAADEGGCSLFSSKMDDEKMSRMLELYEFILSDENSDLAHFGFKDKDYTVVNGKAVSLLPYSETAYGKKKMIWDQYPSVQLGQIVAWQVPYHLPEMTPMYPQWIIDLDKQLIKDKDPYVVMPNVLINKVSTPAKDKSNVVQNWAQIESDLCKIIAGTNVEKDFNDWVTKLLTVDEMQTVIDEVNKAVVEQKLDQ